MSIATFFQKFKGAIYLSLVVIIWVASAILIQQIFKNKSTDFDKPLFLTYFSTSFFMVYLIPLIIEYVRLTKLVERDRSSMIQKHADEEQSTLVKKEKIGNETPDVINAIVMTPGSSNQQSELSENANGSTQEQCENKKTQVSGIKQLQEFKNDIKHTSKLSLEFCILWFGSNFFYNMGLANTSVTSSSILCNTSSVFVYILSLVLLKGTRFDFVKALSVVVTIAGIVTVNLGSRTADSQEGESVKGNVYSLLSAVVYGLYAVILKLRIPNEDEFQLGYFLGMVGLFNAVFLLPLFPILNYAGVEIFEWPNLPALGAMTLNAIFGTVISDFCWCKSVVLLGPLLPTLGIALTIPLAMLYNVIIEGQEFSPVYYLGSVIIVAAFLALSARDYQISTKQKQQEDKNGQTKFAEES